MTVPLHSQVPTINITSLLYNHARNGYSPSVSMCFEGVSVPESDDAAAFVTVVMNRTKHDKNEVCPFPEFDLCTTCKVEQTRMDANSLTNCSCRRASWCGRVDG